MNSLEMTHRQRVEYFVSNPPRIGSAGTEFRRGKHGNLRPLSANGSIGHAAFEAGCKVREQGTEADVVQYVAFSYPTRTPILVRIEDAFAWADKDPLRISVTQVIWKSGSHSWAKSWRDRNGRMWRIGAGAYGDLIVAQR